MRLSGLTTLWTHRPEPGEPTIILGVVDDLLAYPAEGVVPRLADHDGCSVVRIGHPTDGRASGDHWAWLDGVLDFRHAEAGSRTTGRAGRLRGLLTQLDTIGADRIPFLAWQIETTTNALGDKLHDLEQQVASESETRLAISLVFLPEDPARSIFWSNDCRKPTLRS